MPRKQLNIGLTLAQYEAVSIAAENEGQKVTVYCRDAVLEKAMPEPELPDLATLTFTGGVPAGLFPGRVLLRLNWPPRTA